MSLLCGCACVVPSPRLDWKSAWWGSWGCPHAVPLPTSLWGKRLQFSVLGVWAAHLACSGFPPHALGWACPPEGTPDTAPTSRLKVDALPAPPVFCVAALTHVRLSHPVPRRLSDPRKASPTPRQRLEGWGWVRVAGLQGHSYCAKKATANIAIKTCHFPKQAPASASAALRRGWGTGGRGNLLQLELMR